MSRETIIEKAKKYVDSIPIGKFIPGKTYITPANQVIDGDDVASLVGVALDRRYAEGQQARQFEKDLISYFKSLIRGVSLCNSGSSANLLAISTITSKVFGERAAKPNDEIITVASGFPTTINPIVQSRLVPVFVDVDLETFVPDPEVIENAIVEGKTKGIILAHPLGSPFDVETLQDICKEYGIWLIEDTSDALGGMFHRKLLGSFGDLATLSFYPAHMITSGEGGAVLTQSPMVQKVVESFRDWGRDCWCVPGQYNTCGKRFQWKIGDLPEGYDHKYIYSHMGYNLKITDLQASLLVSQLKKLDAFVDARKRNWKALRESLDIYSKYFHFMKPLRGADPCWFGFALTIKETAPFKRNELVQFLEEHQIGTRLLFAGNIIRQPSFSGVRYKTFGEIYNADVIMRDTFWIGCHPAMGDEEIGYIAKIFGKFMDKHRT